MKRRHLLQAASAAIALPGLARAQAYPTKPIRYIVPGRRRRRQRHDRPRRHRALGQGARPDLRRRQPERRRRRGRLPDHRARRARRLHADAGLRRHARHDAGDAQASAYDAIKDFTPIGMIGATPNVLAINANVPAKTVKEFIDYVKRNPGKVSYGSAGAGLADAPDDGAVQAGDRRLHAAHPVPRHRAGDQRPARRPDAGDVPRPGRGAAAPALGPHARAGRHRQAAQPAAEGRADDGGGRLQGLRRDAVVRLGRPGRHAGRRRQAPERDPGRGAQGARPAPRSWPARRSSPGR